MTTSLAFVRRAYFLVLCGIFLGGMLRQAAGQVTSPLPDSGRYDLVLRGGRIVDGTGAPWYVADVAISLETARRQAKQYRVTLQDEVSHLLVHGILHALGYDHEDPVDEKKMRAREERILGRAHHH